MKEIVVKVNEFVGPSYTNGYIGFRYNEDIVPYSIGDHHDSVYHLNMAMIDSLATQFPDYIKAFNRKTDKVSEWGPKTEIGLSKLMMDGKLKLAKRNDEGGEIFVHFTWDGPVWVPKNRPTKRK